MAKRRPPAGTPRDAETNTAALKRVLASQTFGQVERLKRFLRRYVSPFDFALVRFALGQDEVAFKWLNRARKDRAFEMNSLNADPRFDPVRTDPRFRAIVKSIGIP